MTCQQRGVRVVPPAMAGLCPADPHCRVRKESSNRTVFIESQGKDRTYSGSTRDGVPSFFADAAALLGGRLLPVCRTDASFKSCCRPPINVLPSGDWGSKLEG